MREPELSGALGQGATALTATRRLAADLRRRFDLRQIALGRRAWVSADAVSLAD